MAARFVNIIIPRNAYEIRSREQQQYDFFQQYDTEWKVKNIQTCVTEKNNPVS